MDSYGKALIEQQFFLPYKFEAYYQTFQIELNTPKFMRWILKIIYNEMRREKLPLECIQKYIPYIMTREGELTDGMPDTVKKVPDTGRKMPDTTKKMPDNEQE